MDRLLNMRWVIVIGFVLSVSIRPLVTQCDLCCGHNCNNTRDTIGYTDDGTDQKCLCVDTNHKSRSEIYEIRVITAWQSSVDSDEITVHLMRCGNDDINADLPIILSLNNYRSIHWNIRMHPSLQTTNADIKAIYVSTHNTIDTTVNIVANDDDDGNNLFNATEIIIETPFLGMKNITAVKEKFGAFHSFISDYSYSQIHVCVGTTIATLPIKAQLYAAHTTISTMTPTVAPIDDDDNGDDAVGFSIDKFLVTVLIVGIIVLFVFACLVCRWRETNANSRSKQRQRLLVGELKSGNNGNVNCAPEGYRFGSMSDSDSHRRKAGQMGSELDCEGRPEPDLEQSYVAIDGMEPMIPNK